jgi:hypothetical protein
MIAHVEGHVPEVLSEDLPVLNSRSLYLVQGLIGQETQFLSLGLPLIGLLGEHVSKGKVLVLHQLLAEVGHLFLVLEARMRRTPAPFGEITDLE